MMENLQKPVARNQGLIIQELPNEVLIFDLNTQKSHCLNQTSAFIWKACDGNKSITDISNLVGNEFGSSVSEDFVWLAIDQLNTINLLESKIASKFEGTSRREAIKRIGFATVIALPAVMSLSMPTSVMGQVGSCANIPCNLTGAPPVTCVSPCVCSQPTGPGICQ